MPVCSQTSAWGLAFLEVISKRRQRSLRHCKAAFHSLCSGVVSQSVPFSREINPFTFRLSPGAAFRCPRAAFRCPGAAVQLSRSCVQVSGQMSMSSFAMSQRMVWVDLEMTGLDIEKDHIIEMACIITDADLNILAEGPNLIINQPNELLEGMSEWCKEHHGKSGLTQAVQDSKITLEQAEYEFLSFVRQHTPPGQCPLAGNSVHADKRFLDKYMPQFMYHLHYRIVDVSTIKELCRRWFPEEYKMVPNKKAAHRALDDIQESIKELQYYRASVFKASEEKKPKIVENRGSSTS
ncbi:small fragment nuclease [Clinocottus analis]|uniref:small fragment nuclease n=1 Tax=Clinocottus analis TaxID=304258 RepID=UPI0035BF1BC1